MLEMRIEKNTLASYNPRTIEYSAGHIRYHPDSI